VVSKEVKLSVINLIKGNSARARPVCVVQPTPIQREWGPRTQ